MIYFIFHWSIVLIDDSHTLLTHTHAHSNNVTTIMYRNPDLILVDHTTQHTTQSVKLVNYGQKSIFDIDGSHSTTHNTTSQISNSCELLEIQS